MSFGECQATVGVDAPTMILVVGDFVATMELRIATPRGTYTPEREVLQQKWVAPTVNGGVVEEWRNVPRRAVLK